MSRIVLSILLLAAMGAAQWQTFYEQSNYLETPRYDQTIAFAKKLAANFDEATFTTFGKSPQNRALPLLIVDKDGLDNPLSIRKAGRIIVLIQAGIHSGEIEGKDAGFILFRNMLVNGQHQDWLDHISFLFIPIFNVDGHERFSPYGRINQNGPKEMGWRVTSTNLNLNRDFLKADTPEMQAWLRLYNRWLPEFYFDIHTTDGADFQYAITYAIEDKGNMSVPMTYWVRNNYLPQLNEKMIEKDFPTRTYIFFRKRHQVESGLYSWVAPPRFSQGYTALFNRPGLLVETHMLKKYQTRVNATLAILNSTFEILDKEYKNLSRAIAESDQFVQSPEFRAQPYPLQWQMNGDSVMVEFLGFESQTVHSELTGGEWVKFSDRKKTFRIPYFIGQAPTVKCRVPLAYIVPPQWREVIRRLQIHGVEMSELNQASVIPVNSYRFADVKFPARPYESHFVPRFKRIKIEEKRELPAGSVIIPLAQVRAMLILHALEPEGPDSFLKWGFFNAIFERKEYAESYVIEKVARKMLSDDPALNKEFAEKLKNDSTFAASPGQIRNWFYQQTPYFDQKYNKYPVSKIFLWEDLQLLMNSSHPLGAGK